MVARFNGACAYCGDADEVIHMDHVVPLSKGGAHAIGNVLPACAPCNLSKSDKLLSVWRYRERGGQDRRKRTSAEGHEYAQAA
ncbi:MAG: HNH endonuclease [Pseudonocardia sp.]